MFNLSSARRELALDETVAVGMKRQARRFVGVARATATVRKALPVVLEPGETGARCGDEEG